MLFHCIMNLVSSGLFHLAVSAADPGMVDAGPSVSVVPRIRVASASEMVVEVVFENTSSELIRYLVSSDRHPVRRFNLVLLKDGAPLVPIRDAGLQGLSPDDVRQLPPDRHLLHVLDLREVYGKLQPGNYVLEARMNGQPRLFGLTQLRFQKRVMHIEVVSEPPRR